MKKKIRFFLKGTTQGSCATLYIGAKSFQLWHAPLPSKGSFPLGHFSECKHFKKFMKCLCENNFENALCKYESKEYLE